MSCIYLDLGDDNGKCQLFDKDSGIEFFGCDKDGNCICCDDPDPTVTCEDFESIYGEDEEEE